MKAVETLHSHGKLLLNHYSFNCIIIAKLATLCFLCCVICLCTAILAIPEKKLFSRLI